MTTPIMHPAKRRRLDDTNTTLSKPFRSPMRADLKAATSANDNQSHIKPSQNPTAAHGPSGSPPHPSTDKPPPQHKSSPIRKPPPSLLSSPRAPTKDLEYLTLQKRHSALTVQLSKLRQELDTAQQALKIHTSNQDTELEVLISKWRTVSREAAEEIFSTARDRVNCMGGVGAWREKTRQQPRGWGEEEADQIYEDTLTDEQKDLIDEQKEMMQEEMSKYGPGTVEEPTVEKDDETFTMEMMLRSLNVELDLIGYDKEGQRWT